MNFAECSACGEANMCTTQDIYPDNGWVLPFEEFGYYAGFDDNMNVLYGKSNSKLWVFCHDCIVKLLQTFPRLAESLGKNLHHCEEETPCCPHAWQGTKLFGSREPGVHMRTAWPDGQWHDYEVVPTSSR